MSADDEARARMQQILLENVGFEDPAAWVEIAMARGFKRIRAIRLVACPDCGEGPAQPIGQFVYYSTLMHLRPCSRCGLIWVDARLPSEVIERHFAITYKDRSYFERSREPILADLVRHIDERAPRGGRVLDIGGAQGDLMHLLSRHRPDLHLVVRDVSLEALAFASDVHGLETIQGSIGALRQHHGRYDVVVLSDVLYYEESLPEACSVIQSLRADGGTVILRVPNKLPLIRGAALLERWMRGGGRRRMQQDVRFFNPEHRDVLTRRYLWRRLTAMGCDRVRFVVSPPLSSVASPLAKVWQGLLLAAGRLAARLTADRLLLTPSMMVIA